MKSIPTPTLWRFILPIGLLLLLSAAFLIEQETANSIRDVEKNAETQSAELARLLLTSENLLGQQVQASMRLFKKSIQAQGTPSIRGTVNVNGFDLPNLYLGSTSQANHSDLVDQVTDIVGGTATLFVKSGERYVRLVTNVPGVDSSRAVGTLLNPEGKAIAAIRRGQPFYGVVDILGQYYITGYEPLRDVNGETIGVAYVGYKVDVSALREAVQNSRYLKTGFTAVLDDKNQVLFASSHATFDWVKKVVTTHPDDWVQVTTSLPDWGFRVVVAYPRQEARELGFSKMSYTLLLGVALGLIFIFAMIGQLYRLVLRPLGADPQQAIQLVRRIADGELQDDSLKAASGTLMAHILQLRTSLREMRETERQNAEHLSLAASVFEHTRDGIFIADAQGRIIEVNSAFTRLTGHSREEAMAQTLYTLNFSSSTPEMLDQMWPSLAKTGTWHGESRNVRKNGEVYSASMDVFTVRDGSGQVSHYVGVCSDITVIKQQQQHLEHLAYHDALTQLPNRVLFSDRMQQALVRMARSQTLLAVCLLDLDGFKPVNDQLGHEAGDDLLVELAQRLAASLRAGDTVARLGGDEFALLLTDLNGVDECQQAVRRLLTAIAAPFMIAGKEVSVSGSIGVTLSPFDDANPDSLLRHADQAMYQAKLLGGNCFHIFDADHDRRAKAHREALDAVAEALDNGELRLHYQPKVDMRRSRVIGAEALLRWQHPVRGVLYPAEFLPGIESTEFSVDLGNWVINEALRQMQQWKQLGLTLAVSVNISARHLTQPDFSQCLDEHLQRWPGVSPSSLKLEITESTALGDITSVASVIEECQALGVSFALDDFGTGYSSLTYLRRLPAEMLKIDQSFVRDMLEDADDLAIIQGVIGLSRAFHRNVIAEGVENAAQARKLVQMGCDLGQGYGIAKPMEADRIPDWVRGYQPGSEWQMEDDY